MKHTLLLLSGTTLLTACTIDVKPYHYPQGDKDLSERTANNPKEEAALTLQKKIRPITRDSRFPYSL